MSDGLPVMRSMHNVPEEPVRWLWPARVPLGKITMLVGDPGVGKSFLTADIAARVSSARDWPDAPAVDQLKGDVLMLMCEDDPGDTLRPRLAAAGADLQRVHILEGFKGQVDQRCAFLTLDADMDVMARALRTLTLPRLVIIDPITAYMGRVDGNNNSAVRFVLSKLGNLARAFNVAIVMVSHLNKDTAAGTKTVYRTMGALAFTAVSRVVYFVRRDVGQTRVVAPVKSNLLINRDAMAFTIVGGVGVGAGGGAGSAGVNGAAAGAGGNGAGAGGGAGAVGWQATNLAFDPSEIESEEAPLSVVEEAGRWLGSLLEHGPVSSAEVMDRAQAEGVSWGAVRRARDRLGVTSRREGSRGGRWVWCLPGKDGCARGAGAGAADGGGGG